MLVENWMNSPVITVDVKDSFDDAIRLIKENDIRMLPVLKKGKLVGIVTDRDLKRASASDATSLDVYELSYCLSKIKVKSIMTPNPITVPIYYTIEETAEVLLENRISGVPVINDAGKVVGTITQSDLFRVIISLAGIKNKGVQYAFSLEDQPGTIKEVADIIRAYGGRIVSILTSYEDVPHGYRKVYIRLHRIKREKLLELDEELKKKTAILYMVDHRENKRAIY